MRYAGKSKTLEKKGDFNMEEGNMRSILTPEAQDPKELKAGGSESPRSRVGKEKHIPAAELDSPPSTFSSSGSSSDEVDLPAWKRVGNPNVIMTAFLGKENPGYDINGKNAYRHSGNEERKGQYSQTTWVDIVKKNLDQVQTRNQESLQGEGQPISHENEQVGVQNHESLQEVGQSTCLIEKPCTKQREVEIIGPGEKEGRGYCRTTPPGLTQQEQVAIASAEFGGEAGLESEPNLREDLGHWIGLNGLPEDTDRELGLKTGEQNWVDSIDEANNLTRSPGCREEECRLTSEGEDFTHSEHEHSEAQIPVKPVKQKGVVAALCVGIKMFLLLLLCALSSRGGVLW
ncbi:hypothetical protein V6N11_044728 [Hibiscus sabdariffa]|uniref:Uncharacterized protein n=1 Tax=Hibiscus sabdariffa TaxID=183260 RepID=A0ABR2PTU6_9ROSI